MLNCQRVLGGTPPIVISSETFVWYPNQKNRRQRGLLIKIEGNKPRRRNLLHLQRQMCGPSQISHLLYIYKLM